MTHSSELSTTKPNILFILTDQQNSRMLSCAGNQHVSTPAMDSIAAEGVRFDRAYCTNPVCVASRFSLMSGLMPSAIRMFSNRVDHVGPIPDSIKANGLGFLLRAAGYEAVYAGKEHLPNLSSADVGFDCICRDERDALAAACADFLRQKRDRPFCLVASFINPHDICYMAIRDSVQNRHEQHLVRRGALECTTLDAALARPAGIDDDLFFAARCPPLPPNFEPQEDEPEAIDMMLNQRPFRAKARREWSERRWREHRWAYAKLTEMVDRQIQHLLDALRESGQNERTLIVFTSDHGDMDGSHRMEHKSTLYDEACRIPLILRPPGKPKPGRVDHTHLVSNGLDLLPTLCDWTGVAPPADRAGRSLRPLMEDADCGDWRDYVPIESAVGRAIVTRQFKYALYDIGGCREQLIDLMSDPHEKRNAINDPRFHSAIEQLKGIHCKDFGKDQRASDDVLKDMVNG